MICLKHSLSFIPYKPQTTAFWLVCCIDKARLINVWCVKLRENRLTMLTVRDNCGYRGVMKTVLYTEYKRKCSLYTTNNHIL